MPDEMNEIVICRHCGKPEYYGELRWRSGIWNMQLPELL